MLLALTDLSGGGTSLTFYLHECVYVVAYTYEILPRITVPRSDVSVFCSFMFSHNLQWLLANLNQPG